MENFIDKKAIIAPSAVIYPGNYIEGECKIGEGTILYPGNFIKNSEIGNNCEVHASVIKDSVIKDHVGIGPNAHLRNGCVIEDFVRIGNFVEIKKSIIKSGTKVAHLAYIGDAEVGNCCNIGCGVIFCNYDGKVKHKTFIGNNVFVGSNCNLIAPITIKDDCFIAAGSTITKDMKEKTFAIARAKQENRPKR